MKKRLFVWETSGGLFIAVFGTSLHFAFGLNNFWKPVAIIFQSMRAVGTLKDGLSAVILGMHIGKLVIFSFISCLK